MTGRPTARLLAPAALVTTALALLLILASGGGGGDVASQEREAAQPAQTAETTGSEESGEDSEESGGSGKKGPKRYTVEPGDTPSGIAEKVDIPLEELLELNPEVDPQTLTPGQKLRLR